MRYRRLGRTGLQVSEIGFGAEWMEQAAGGGGTRSSDACEETGINLMDVLDGRSRHAQQASAHAMAERGTRDQWIIQGHIGSTWQNGQYVRTRDMEKVSPAFEDLLARLGTDYVDLGMIHLRGRRGRVPSASWRARSSQYVRELQAARARSRHIGHEHAQPRRGGELAASVRRDRNDPVQRQPGLRPAAGQRGTWTSTSCRRPTTTRCDGIDPGARGALQRSASASGVGITVMKGYAGGPPVRRRRRSPFGVALTPVQCIHYALTRPAVASILAGFSDAWPTSPTPLRYETATEDEKDYASVLANAPRRMPSAASAPTAATAPPARQASTSPR